MQTLPAEIADKIDFKAKRIIQAKKTHYINFC